MMTKRLVVAALGAVIAVCLFRIAGVGHEADPVPWWWSEPLHYTSRVLYALGQLRLVPRLALLALPVVAVVYLLGRVMGPWDSVTPGRAARIGAVGAVLSLVPAAALYSLLAVHVWVGPVQATDVALGFVLLFGLVVGLTVVPPLGALAAAAAVACFARRPAGAGTTGHPTTAFAAVSATTTLVVYGFLDVLHSNRNGPAAPVLGTFLFVFMTLALVAFTISRLRRAPRPGARRVPAPVLQFGSCLLAGWLLGAAFHEPIGFLTLGLIAGAVFAGAVFARDRARGERWPLAEKEPPTATPVGVADPELDRLDGV